MIFFFMQKTAYEMRMSVWSSDVCSSDLVEYHRWADLRKGFRQARRHDVGWFFSFKSSDDFAFAKFGWCRRASAQPKNGGRGDHDPHGPIVADFNILSNEARMKVLRTAALIVGAVALVATGIGAVVGARSADRRVGKEGVSTCRSRWAPCH